MVIIKYMHVISPARYRAPKKQRPWWLYVAVPAAVVVIASAVNVLRPLPAGTAELHVTAPAPTTPYINWPGDGQAAIAARDYGLLGTSGNQTPLATASIAKVITALCVLQKAPLAVGQTGPTYTISPSDVAIYNNYVAQDGSLLVVRNGEQLTEYQALQALMIPSANNIADSLVRWVFGSQSAYAVYAAEFLQQNGMDNTHIGTDASGFDPSTTSTASDLTQLGQLALKNPVLMSIAGQSSAAFPIAGTLRNYNTVLGQNGITGLKTGNNDVDQGAFLLTATAHIGDKTIPVTGTVMGATSLSAALQQSVQLAASLENGFEQVTVSRAGTTVGTMHTAWGGSAPITTAAEVQVIRWKATPVTAKHTLNTHLRSGVIGTLRASAGPSSAQAKLLLAHPIAGPSFWWRLTRF